MSDPVLSPLQVMAIITPWPGTPNSKYTQWQRTYDNVPIVTPDFMTDWQLAVWISENYDGPPIPPADAA
jgi:hypothetical protein